MTYIYYCNQCKKHRDVEKPMVHSDRKEFCYVCGELLERVFNSVGIRTGDGIKQS